MDNHEHLKMKIKNMTCKQLRCKECPLCVKLCQTFIDNQNKTIGSIIEKMYLNKRLSEIEYKNAKVKAEKELLSKCVYMELNCNDKLIRDEVKHLNNKNKRLPAYCFSKEQAEEIVKRCKYRCKVETDGEIYIITKV